MAKAEASVEELVGMMDRGELRLPEMQRRYVWRSTRVRDLMDSLYRGYPSGAILLWETDEAVPLQDMAVAQQAAPYQSQRLLLDGQQRLTSLSAVIRGQPVTVRGRRKPIELLFNLEHPEHLSVVTEVDEDGAGDDDDAEVEEDAADSSEDELQKRFNQMAFVVATRKLEQLPQWVKVSEVFAADSDAPFLKRAGVTGFEDDRYEKYSRRLARLRAIRKYSYRMDVLERTLKYDEVTEIFVRVNSLGAKLRSSDLALAQITARWRGALKIFQAYQDKCAKMGFELDLGLHLKNLVAFATGQSRFLTIAGVPVEKLKEGWEAAVKGMDFALNFMRANVGIDSPALLSSPFLLVTLGYYGHKREYQLDAAEEVRVRAWVLLANAKGRYSRGSSETLLDQDLSILRQGGGVEELVDRLRQQVGRLDIAPDELEGRNQRSALFKTMFLAFSAAGAKDWNSNLAVAIDHSGVQHRLQFHHVFPKAYLKSSYTSREADDIANLAFIGGGTNRGISAKPPAEYFPALLAKNGEATFVSQCIPTSPELLGLENYKQFLAERRKLIAARLNQFLEIEQMAGSRLDRHSDLVDQYPAAAVPGDAPTPAHASTSPAITIAAPSDPNSPSYKPNPRRTWTDESFQADVKRRLEDGKAKSVIQLYEFCAALPSAKTWFGNGERATFNTSFPPTIDRSLLTILSDGRLWVNFMWASQTEEERAIRDKLFDLIRHIPSLNLQVHDASKGCDFAPDQWLPAIQQIEHAIRVAIPVA